MESTFSFRQFQRLWSLQLCHAADSDVIILTVDFSTPFVGGFQDQGISELVLLYESLTSENLNPAGRSLSAIQDGKGTASHKAALDY
jgi:hypothetical protein